MPYAIPSASWLTFNQFAAKNLIEFEAEIAPLGLDRSHKTYNLICTHCGALPSANIDTLWVVLAR